MNIGWRSTWEDKENDYSAYTEDGTYVGRVYWLEYSNAGSHWLWFAADGVSGKAQSRREAMIAVEDEWNSANNSKKP